MHRAAGMFGVALAFGAALGRSQGLGDETPSHPIPSGLPTGINRRVSIYFPPQPPPLGQAISPNSYSVPSADTWHVNETFYPALRTLSATEKMSERLLGRIAQYRAAKRALQNELYDIVYANDRMLLGAVRTNAFKTLAAAQAARLVELDKLAEEIRPGLVDFVESAALGGNLFSPTLQARIGRMFGGYLSAQKEAVSKIFAILTAAKSLPVRGSFRFEGVHLKYYVAPKGVTSLVGWSAKTAVSPEATAHAATVRAEADAVANAYGRHCRRDRVRSRALQGCNGASIGAAHAERHGGRDKGLLSQLSRRGFPTRSFARTATTVLRRGNRGTQVAIATRRTPASGPRPALAPRRGGGGGKNQDPSSKIQRMANTQRGAAATEKSQDSF